MRNATLIAVLIVVLSFGAFGAGTVMKQVFEITIDDALFGLSHVFSVELTHRNLTVIDSRCQKQLSQINLTSGQRCSLAIDPGGVRVRKADVKAVRGRLELTYRPNPSDNPRPSVEVEKTLDPPNRLQLDVFGEGGTLAIECLGTVDCHLRIVPRQTRS